jgi:hypothetical protein
MTRHGRVGVGKYPVVLERAVALRAALPITHSGRVRSAEPVTDVVGRIFRTIDERCQITHAMSGYNSRTRLIVKLKSTSRARVGSNRSLSIFVRYLVNSINTLSSVKNSALSPSCGSPIDADAVDF